MGRVHAVKHQPGATVHDSQVVEEIELMTKLIVATSQSDSRLSQAEIDQILGLAPVIPRVRQPLDGPY
jgi:hypothetical protein